MDSEFAKKVYKLTAMIPKGQTRTYKQIAELTGNPRACRAVGNVLNKNYDPAIPCHRVIRSDGQPGGYNRGSRRKIKILKQEKAI